MKLTEKPTPTTKNPADVLPPSCRDALIAASKIDNPTQRRAAIDAAELMARARSPALFNGPAK